MRTGFPSKMVDYTTKYKSKTTKTIEYIRQHTNTTVFLKVSFIFRIKKIEIMSTNTKPDI